MYQQNCATCHSANAEGAPNWATPGPDGLYPPPPHDDTGHTWHHSDRVLYEIIRDGMGDPLRPDSPLRMLAWGSTLSDADIRAVIGYFKSLWTAEHRQWQWNETLKDFAPTPTIVPQASKATSSIRNHHTNPPTSGPHYAQPAKSGFYNDAIADETLVHNLEHGYVIVWYNCTSLDESQCQTFKTQIGNVVSSAGPKVVAVPRPDMDTLIAVTSWGRIDKLTRFDEAEIGDFINSFRGRAPEGNAP